MLYKNSLALVVISVLPMSAALAQGETIEDVRKKIADMNKNVKSMQADMKMQTKFEQPGFSQSQETVGTYEFKRDGDLVKARSESTMKGTMNAGGMTKEMNQKVLTVSNGKVSYAYSEDETGRSVTKIPVQDQVADDPLGSVEDTYDMKLLPDATVNGDAVYVVEMTPKDGQEQQGVTNKLHYFFRKNDGLLTKMVIFGPDGKPMSTMEYTNIKVNVPIDDSRFDYTPPAGVQVIDMSQMQTEMPLPQQ